MSKAKQKTVVETPVVKTVKSKTVNADTKRSLSMRLGFARATRVNA